jgi:hypothetical protein
MVTDALWTDFDNDGKVDLVITGEWMPLTFFRNTGNGFSKLSSTGIEQHSGWWNSITAGDFDNDGDIDYVAGNLGLNSSYTASADEPMTILAKDLDKNGSIDPMVFCYMKDTDSQRKSFPMPTKDDLSGQMISMRKKFPTYKSYGLATMNDIWTETDRQDALILQATDMHTSYIENKGNGRFEIKPLPLEAQTAPVYGMIAKDLNEDGNLDLLLVGNDYGMEPYSGRHDAFMGLCLLGDGKGNFSSTTLAQSGFCVKGDAKGLALVHTAKQEDIFLASQNQDSVMVYKRNGSKNNTGRWINLESNDFYAEIFYKNGSQKHVEFYYGSAFLSQSSWKLAVDSDVIKIVITNYKGIKRTVL